MFSKYRSLKVKNLISWSLSEYRNRDSSSHSLLLSESEFLKVSEWLLEDALLQNKPICNVENEQVSLDAEKRFKEFIRRKILGEPLAYISGYQNFYGLRIEVDKRVLIPRAETELVVLKSLEFLKRYFPTTNPINVLDICCGSGCIGLALVKNLTQSYRLEGWDISFEALEVAKKNADQLDVEANFLTLDILEPWPFNQTFDLIVCNPPYIDDRSLEALEHSVLGYEPRIALWGGSDGLKFYRQLGEMGPLIIKKGALFVCEIGYDQGRRVLEILAELGWTILEVVKDYQGHDRVVVATIL